VDGSKVLINTIVTGRMIFTKTSQKFCQWVDSKANQVYGLGFVNENDLTRVNVFKKNFVLREFFFVQFMDKFIEVKEATRNALRSSSVDSRHTSQVETITFFFY